MVRVTVWDQLSAYGASRSVVATSVVHRQTKVTGASLIKLIKGKSREKTIRHMLAGHQPNNAGGAASVAVAAATSGTASSSSAEENAKRIGYLIREEERPDIENFVAQFPEVATHYIPVGIIGEGI